MKLRELISEDWSTKYKKSIDCSHPKGFSQRAHCQGRKKNEDLNDNDPRNQIWYGGNNDPDGPRTHQDYRVTDKIDFEGLPAGLIYKIRSDAMRIPSGIKGLKATQEFYKKYKKYLKPHHAADTKKESAGDRGDIPTGPGEQLIPFPAGTTMIDVSDAYDWYKLGMVISDLDDADPKIFGQGAPHTAIVFGSEEEEHKLLPLLKRLGLSVHDIDTPQDVKKAIPAKALIQRMEENFAEDSEECPPATQDIKLNLENRQKAIDEYGYGPLNPDLPNTKFWLKKVDEWNLDSASEAKQSLCGNCAAFDVRQKTLDCIAKGIDSENSQDAEAVIDAGDLGYCKFLKFKCASRRTCDAWVTGGPLTDEQGVSEGLKPKDIHRLADRKGVKWDNEPSFLRLTKRLTGKAHLDDLDQTGLQKVKQYLEKQGVSEGRGLAPVNPYVELMQSLGWFMSMNTAKIQQDAVDSASQQELKIMQQQFNKPIINGKTFADILSDNTMLKHPKIAPVLLKFAYDILGYIEPRIKRYIRPDLQSKWITLLSKLKDQYRAAVQFTSGQQGVAEGTGDLPSDPGPKEFVSNKFYVKFTADALLIFDSGELVYKRPGNYSNPTRRDVSTAKSATDLLWKVKHNQYTTSSPYIVLKPADIHRVADEKGISWDNSRKFMNLSKKLTGKVHLDDMTPEELKTMFDYLTKIKVAENFADGRNPQDKGDSARHGIRKGMSIAQLKKIRSSDTASARKKQLAHWQINMRSGKNK